MAEEGEFAALQRRLAALKGEARSLDAAIIEIAHEAAAQRASTLPAGSHSQLTPTYSALEMKREVGKRAGAIRRAGVAGAAFMAVVLVCTLALPEPGRGGANELLGGAGASGLSGVPEALRAVGPELTAGEQKLFASDARRLQAEEALHQKLERERAEHLLKMITSAVSHNEQHAAMEKRIAQQVQEHRERRATVQQERRSMIRGTDGVVGQPHAVFAPATGRTMSLTGRPMSLTGEIDEAFRQQLMAQHAKNADRRQERESRFMRERQASELAQQSKDRAVDDARARYHEARQLVVKAKDALKDALAERDQQTEKVRSEGFISEKEALAQLAPVQDKVKKLVKSVEAAKRNWEAAQVMLQSAESIGTRPELSFPAAFAHPAGQKLVLAPASKKEESAPTVLSASARKAAAEAALDDLLKSQSAQKISKHVSNLAAPPRLVGGAKAMVKAAKHRLAIKAGLTGSLEHHAAGATAGPHTWGGEDLVVPMPTGTPGIFKASTTQALAGRVAA
jgi:hypothetical protein